MTNINSTVFLFVEIVMLARNELFSVEENTLTGNIFVNFGMISLDIVETFTLGNCVHIEIDSNGTSSISVAGSTSLASTLEIALDQKIQLGTYIILA